MNQQDPKESPPNVQTRRQDNPRKTNRFSIGKEKNEIIERLSVLLSSGVNVHPALESMRVATRSKYLKNTIRNIQENLRSGSSLWEALEQSGLFPEHTIALIRKGEETGTLHNNLKKIVAQQHKDKTFAAKMRPIIPYPVLLIVFTIAIILGGAWFVISRTLPTNTPETPINEASITETELPLHAKIKTEETKTVKKTTTKNSVNTLEIAPTGLGYLNVRSTPYGEILTQVTPGESYEYTEVQNGWYKIILKDESYGWVIGTYIQTVE